MSTNQTPAKTKPGSGFFLAAVAVFALGIFFMIVSANTHDRYGDAMGPTPGLVLVTFVVPLVLGAIGFARRVLFLLEARNK